MPLPELAAALGVVVVIFAGLLALRTRGNPKDTTDRAAAARRARAQRLGAQDVVEVRRELQRLLDVAEKQRQHAAAIAGGRSGEAEQAALAAALRTVSTQLSLCRGVYVTRSLSQGQIAGYLAQYRQPSVEQGTVYEIDQAIAAVSQRLWTSLQQGPNREP